MKLFTIVPTFVLCFAQYNQVDAIKDDPLLTMRNSSSPFGKLSLRETKAASIMLDDFHVLEEKNDVDHDFSSWLHENGVKSNNVIMGPSLYGRGRSYIANSTIEEGDVLLSIPISLIMSTHSAKDARIGVMLEVNPDLPEVIILTLHLLEEKFRGPSSKWYPFIKHLPEKLNSTLTMTEVELKPFEGSQIYRLTQTRHEAVDKFFNALVGPVTSNALDPPLFTEDQFTLDNFKWAIGVVWACTVQMENLSTQKIENMLIPVFDSLEHSPGQQNHISMDDSAKNLLLFSSKRLEKGGSVGLNIGSKDRGMFILNHGFVPNTFPDVDDSVPISIGLREDDALYELKGGILASQNLTLNGIYTLYANSDPSPDIFLSMRIKLMKGDEIESYKKAVDGKAISIRNECAVYRSIYQACDALLKGFPTTIEEDQAHIDGGNLSEYLHDITESIMTEKKILIKTRKWIKEKWTELLTADDI